jgi:YbbR domain-containing protein
MVHKKFPHWLRSNLTSFTLAILVSLTVWIIASQEQNPVQESELQPAVVIAVKGLVPGLLIANDYPKATTLRLRAQENTWLSLSSQDVLVTADLTGLGPGQHQVPLSVQVMAQAGFVSANPSSIQITIEEERQREIQVHVKKTGQLAVGYSSGAEVIDPVRVTISGPRSAVDLVNDVVAAVSLASLTESISAELSLVAIDAEGNTVSNVTIEPAVAQVTVPVTLGADYRVIAIVVPDPIGEPAAGYNMTGIKVTPNLITVHGDPQIINAMQPYVLTQPVNLSGLTDSLVTEVALDLPSGVTPVGSTSIQIRITIEAVQGSQSLEIPIQAVGLDRKLKADFSPVSVTVILSGPIPILDQLRITEDIIVTVDLTGLKPGTHQIEPKVELGRRDIAVETKSPVVITVTITTQ